MATSTLDRDEQQGQVPRQRPRRGADTDPPGTESRKRKKKRGAPLSAKLAITFGALLMMVSGAALIGVKTVVGNLEGNIQVSGSDELVDPEASAEPAEPTGKEFAGAFNILLLGIDTRVGQKASDARSDTILILHVSQNHDQAYLMSVPRDVNIPGSQQKINGAFTNGLGANGDWRGGLKSAAKSISKLTGGMVFQAAAVIDFGGFKTFIEALGTVPMCVEAPTESIHHFVVKGKPTYVGGIADDHEADSYARRTGRPRVLHKPGCRNMRGWEALDYARQRYLPDGSGDYGRQRHQQQLIKAMAKKAGSAGVLTDFGKVNKLIAAVGKSLLLSLPKGMGVTDFMFTMKDMAGADLVLLKTNAGTYKSIMVNGKYQGEGLDDATRDMFRAAKNDKLGNYVLLHPEVVNNEK
ncbi:LCP family protein [Catellatospora sichuanensis]|uniref:LCP family protein n=1 Tax=Catellatospora sichuanensis TaxID=1969805 RepID=UPI001183B0C2|nr:LCP family protein [Catellatospora sichuanensis]